MVAWLTRAAALASISWCMKGQRNSFQRLRSRMPKRRRCHAQTDAPGGASANEWWPGASVDFSQGSNLKGQVTTAVRVTRTPCPSLGQEIRITLLDED